MSVLAQLTSEVLSTHSLGYFEHSITESAKGVGCPNEFADELKTLMRRSYVRWSQPQSYQEAMRHQAQMWTRYEAVNRILCENDPVYSIINAGTALSTTADNLTWEASAAGQTRILEIVIGGEGTASAVNRVAVQRAGTSITGNSAITPEKFNTRSPNAGGTYGKAGTQALVGNPMHSWAFNAFGGFIRWLAAPGEEMYVVNSEVISMRSASGTSIVSSTGIFEEL